MKQGPLSPSSHGSVAAHTLTSALEGKGPWRPEETLQDESQVMPYPHSTCSELGAAGRLTGQSFSGQRLRSCQEKQGPHDGHIFSLMSAQGQGLADLSTELKAWSTLSSRPDWAI